MIRTVTTIIKRNSDFLFPIASAFLLILTSYPFNIWPFVFIALAPLFYFIYRSWDQGARLFWGVFLASFFPILSTSYWNLSSFVWVPEAHLFQSIMHIIPLPIAIFFGIATGLSSVFACKVATYFKKSPDLSLGYVVFVLPASLTLIEIGVNAFSRGYDFSVFAYSVHTLPMLVSLAAIGGAHFVSFIIIAFNTVVATACYIISKHADLTYQKCLWRVAPLIAYTIGAMGILGTGAYIYNKYLHHNQATTTVSVALIQNTDTFGGMFGTLDAKGVFRYEKVENLIKETGVASPDIIIYPYALADYVLRASSTPALATVDTAPVESIARWTTSVLPSTAFVSWDDTLRDGKVYSEIHYWKGGVLYGSYAKRIVFPFLDYTPPWLEDAGFYTTALDTAPMTLLQPPTILDGARIAGAVCSEITERGLVRENVRDANLLFSIGSNAMFATPMTDEFTLASAQFRAAENNRPVIRANRMGPSAIIDNRGTIISQMSPNQSGVLSREITLEIHPRKTLYSLTSDWLILSMCIILLMLLFY